MALEKSAKLKSHLQDCVPAAPDRFCRVNEQNTKATRLRMPFLENSAKAPRKYAQRPVPYFREISASPSSLSCIVASSCLTSKCDTSAYVRLKRLTVAYIHDQQVFVGGFPESCGPVQSCPCEVAKGEIREGRSHRRRVGWRGSAVQPLAGASLSQR